MRDVLIRCTCLRMDEEGNEFVCGEPFQRKYADDNWYWCLYCDAHYSECANKGSKNYLDCPSDPPPPCRTEPIQDGI